MRRKQAEMNGLGHRYPQPIFSLGVLSYELIPDTTPFLHITDTNGNARVDPNMLLAV
jgi:hypothetical protein